MTPAPDLDDDDFEAVVARVETDGALVAPGVRLSPEQLATLLAAAPVEPTTGRARVSSIDVSGSTVTGPVDFRRVTFGQADFGQTTFSADAHFAATTFQAEARFAGATFHGETSFAGADFAAYADFSGATFEQHAQFAEAVFRDFVRFDDATMRDVAGFEATQFMRHVSFWGATFWGDIDGTQVRFAEDATFTWATIHGEAAFELASFGGVAGFEETTFLKACSFADVTFARFVDFNGATFGSLLDASGATFERATHLGPLLAHQIYCNETVFTASIRIVATARRASFERAEFRAGADIRLRWADVSLEGADFAQASSLSGVPALGMPGEVPPYSGEEPLGDSGWASRLDARPAGFAPRLVSLRGAKVAQLTLSTLDLRACLLSGSHGLDRLRLEGVRFAQPPAGHGLRRWTGRRTIAEEHRWRSTVDGGAAWYEDPVVQAASWLDATDAAPGPGQLAGIYRALRKGREDEKDEPGAADFYYGEMEMRRQAPGSVDAEALSGRTGSWAERRILWAYWLVAGYGLRASRALLALAATLALLAVPLAAWGFQPDRSYGRALLFAAEGSISLLHAPSADHLTASGQAIAIVLRLAGPLFFGLAVLALRSRVKR